jgi:hypothetical protein
MKVTFRFWHRKKLFEERTVRQRIWFGRGKNPKYRIMLGAVFGKWRVKAVGHEGFTPVVDMVYVG